MSKLRRPLARSRASSPTAWTVSPKDGGALLLVGKQGRIQVSALGPDLLRIRARAGGAFSHHASAAVLPGALNATAGNVHTEGTIASFFTESGRFQFDRASGHWAVLDAGGLIVASGSTPPTFSGRKTQIRLDLIERELLFGLGEGTGPLNRRGLVREFWNIDVLGHAPAIHPALQSLYVSIPFALSQRDGRVAGWFWDSPARQTWDLGQSNRSVATLSADSEELDLYLFLGPTMPAVVGRFTELTGRPPLPPRWALGFQQCRYSYESRDELETVAREFRRRKLPCDVLYLDIHHLDGHRVFTFGSKFPRPVEMLARLARKGFKTVTIVDPGVKDDPHFGVLKRGTQLGAFVRDAADQDDFLGEVWPGRVRFPDFLNPKVREWWGLEQRRLTELGVAGIWNDMNEPANFARPDKTLDPEAFHHTPDGAQRHVDVHNLYGQAMAQASREGLLAHARTGRKKTATPRPFVVTRAGYAGIQRHAIVWTGDNSSHWEHLRDAVPALLNLSLSGVSACGADVGGFLGVPTPELFARWFQFAAFTPFFRNHTNHGTPAQEPWAFGSIIEELCRLYLNLRYQLIPYFYCLTVEARRTGAPWMRPLCWHYANDAVAAGCEDQFLVGSDLLIAPILQPGATARCVYLPNDLWFDFWTGERHPGGRHIVVQAPMDQIPLLVRAGALLPMECAGPHVSPSAQPTISLHCWPRGNGVLEWHEDDGTTEAYHQGVVCHRRIRSRTRGRTLELEFEPESGAWSSTVNTWRLILWGARSASELTVNGVPFPASFDAEGQVCIAEIPNSPGALHVRFTGLSA